MGLLDIFRRPIDRRQFVLHQVGLSFVFADGLVSYLREIDLAPTLPPPERNCILLMMSGLYQALAMQAIRPMVPPQWWSGIEEIFDESFLVAWGTLLPTPHEERGAFMQESLQMVRSFRFECARRQGNNPTDQPDEYSFAAAEVVAVLDSEPYLRPMHNTVISAGLRKLAAISLAGIPRTVQRIRFH